MIDRLYRTRGDRMLGGVAAGVADYFLVDPTLVRVLWAVLALFSGGVLLVLYVVMWIVVPEEPLEEAVGSASTPEGATAGGTPTGGTTPGAVPVVRRLDADQRRAARQRRRAERAARTEGSMRGLSAGAVFGIVLIVLGGWFLLEMLVPWLDLGRLWPVFLIALGVIVLVTSLRPRGGTRPPGAPGA